MWSCHQPMVAQSLGGSERAGSGIRESTSYKPNKVSYLSVPGEHPLLGLTVGQLIDQAVEKYPDSYGLIVSDINLKRTFLELKEEIDDLAAGLLDIGLERGDRIGIWGPNSHSYYLTQMAAWKAGLILVNINSAYQPNELLYCLQNVGVKCLVIAENFKTQNYYEMVCQIIPEIPNSEPGKISSKAVLEFKTVITMESESRRGTFTLEDVMALGRSDEAKLHLAAVIPHVQFDDVCNIQFTSGTTGKPKGAMLTHHNIVNNSFLIGKRAQFTEKDRICLTVPLFHCYGSVLGTLVALHNGAGCVFPATAFSGEACMLAASKEKCTVVYGTPTMHIAMMKAAEQAKYDLNSLRIACTAGAICPEILIRQMKSVYTVDSVISIYGMTETSPAIFQSLSTDSDALRSGSVGYPLEHTEVKIIDTAGQVVPLGVPGEMCARGYLTMFGYWNDREKTDSIISPTKWLKTGDLMVMMESGHAEIVGRLKDTIIRGGENIYPKEVEEFLHTNPKIQEAQVFGVPDYRMGEEVMTWIMLKENEVLSEQEVRDYCRGQIAHYKIPRYVEFVTDFPRTASGKLQKFRMREEAIKTLNLLPEIPCNQERQK